MRNISSIIMTIMIVALTGCNHTLVKKETAKNYEIDSLSVMQHIQYLASDELEGRYPGTAGDDKAVTHIVDHFKKYGIEPYPGQDYLQEFKVTTGVNPGPNNFCKLGDSKLELNKNYTPYGFSGLGDFSGSLVFAGYGIKSDEAQWDDFASLDAKEKCLIILLSDPPIDEMLIRKLDETPQKKVLHVRDMGASAVIFTNPESDDFPKLQFDQRLAAGGIPVVYIPFSELDEKFTNTKGRKLSELVVGMKHAKRSLAFDIPEVQVDMRVDLIKEESTTTNVIGFIKGKNSKGKCIVIGAHKDHLGWGGLNTSSVVPDTTAIHNGADDNASGAVGMLELAKYFSDPDRQLDTDLLFIGFGAEEMGTLGSTYYTKNPYIPNENTLCMINLDMIGRLDNNNLIIFGSESSPDFQSALKDVNNSHSFNLVFNTDGIGPSDHGPFYYSGIPSLFFFTGTHKDYHHPNDDWQFIKGAGEVKVLNFVSDFVKHIDSLEEAPVYQKVKTTAPKGGGKRGLKVKFGVTPEFASSEKGLAIKAVAPGGSAEHAGIQGGDVIIAINGKEITGIGEYMYRLQDFKPGDAVSVTVKRQDKIIEFEVKL